MRCIVTLILVLGCFISARAQSQVIDSSAKSNAALSAPAFAKAMDEDINLYPNPAYNEINITFPAGMDVKSITIFNNIGKMSAIYKISGNSANLNIEALQGGIYFARLYDTFGDLKATVRFTKQ